MNLYTQEHELNLKQIRLAAELIESGADDFEIDATFSNAINEMRAAGKNHQEIATDLMGGAVACLVDSIGTAETASFLRQFADEVENHRPELEDKPN
jgi:hypothetical protein